MYLGLAQNNDSNSLSKRTAGVRKINPPLKNHASKCVGVHTEHLGTSRERLDSSFICGGVC